MCKGTVAVDRKYKPKDGERPTDFFDVVAWRGNAEFFEKYFRKGQEVIVQGEMQSRKWEDKNGSKRTSWEINADNIEFCGSKQDGAYTHSAASATPAPSPTPGAEDDFTVIDDTEDLPFQ